MQRFRVGDFRQLWVHFWGSKGSNKGLHEECFFVLLSGYTDGNRCLRAQG